MPKIKIERCLYPGGYKPYYATCRTHKIKASYVEFSTLAKLKEYYGIKKVDKSGAGWAINSAGNKIDWVQYEAEISDDFITNFDY